MLSWVRHTEEEASGVLTHRKCERRQPRKIRKLIATIASLSIVSVGLIVTMTAAVNPGFLNQWYTLYEESQGSNVIYKVEVKITKITVTAVKAADLDIRVRVTNNHPFGVHLTSASFKAYDIRERATLRMSLPDSIIPANSVSDIFTTGMVNRVLGLGYKYQVDGTITWNEIYASGEVGPFTKDFHERHNALEFLHG